MKKIFSKIFIIKKKALLLHRNSLGIIHYKHINTLLKLWQVKKIWMVVKPLYVR